MTQLNTPVVLLMFNRPDTTKQVFEAIRRARPTKLLVVADGPRIDKPEDEELCRQTRSILDRVDWPCQVDTNISSENLGCMRRVSSGIDWVFENVEEAIILEDDCLPHPSFFQFCTELLYRYRNEPRVAQIGGVNLQFGQRSSAGSYYFSRYNHVWGWATWRRAWTLNDNAMVDWPTFRDTNGLERHLTNKKEIHYWKKVLDLVASGDIDSWACRWTLSCWRNNLVTVLPCVNLISNIGFGSDATHTTAVESKFANIPTEKIIFPLTAPDTMDLDREADEFTGRTLFREQTLMDKIHSLVRRLF